MTGRDWCPVMGGATEHQEGDGVIAEDVQGSETGQWPGDRMGRI